MNKILNDSYSACVEIMKERAVSFHYTFVKLPEKKFRSVAALYAFCRYADDLVDGSEENGESFSGEIGAKKLDELQSCIERIYQGESFGLQQEWGLALEDTIRRFQIPIDGFLMQIEGQRKDTFFEDIETTEELVRYSRLVAGSVGRLLMPLLLKENENFCDPTLIESCEGLGVAMQITNILRDVGEDLRNRDRLYLPKNLLTKYNISRRELSALSLLTDDDQAVQRIKPEFILLWEELAELADRFYCKFEESIFRFDPSCRFPLIAAALVYRSIADAVRKEGYNCFTKRCYTDALTRNKLILKAAGYKKTGVFCSSAD